MAVNTIGTTNLGLRSTYQPIFDTDSLNTIGGRVIEREQNPTAVSDIRGCTLYELGPIRMWNENFGGLALTGGTVEFTIGTVSDGPSSEIQMSPDYIANSLDVSSITLTFTPDYGNTFLRWARNDGSSGNTISFSNPASVSLTNTDLNTATDIYAVFE